MCAPLYSCIDVVPMGPSGSASAEAAVRYVRLSGRWSRQNTPGGKVLLNKNYPCDFPQGVVNATKRVRKAISSSNSAQFRF